MTTGTKLLDSWLAPDGAGRPVACLATTYAFDVDFFGEDCLSRFLQLDLVAGEGDRFHDIASVLEEEDRLSETRVVVLADRTCNPEARNLRWDLLPVAVPGGLLHAKVTLLLWEHAGRILIGSANLTRAGYRSQVEAMSTFDLMADGSVPRPFVDAFLDELEDLIDLAPGRADEPGPRQRALEIVTTARDRVDGLDLPESNGRLRVALAPARPGQNPIEVLREVWSGGKPKAVTAISPFWDKDSTAAATAITGQLVARAPAHDRPEVWFVIPIQQLDADRAAAVPRSIVDAVPKRITVCLQEFPVLDDELRLLHAKVLVYESATWIAAMIGSSNLTASGLGLRASVGHREVNVWFACSVNAPEAVALRSLAVYGEPLDPNEITEWDEGVDEDEIPHPPPPGIVGLLLAVTDPPELAVQVDVGRIAEWWQISFPTGEVIATADTWATAGQPIEYTIALEPAPLPQAMTITWTVGGEHYSSSYPVNVADPSTLPPVDELRNLPADVLLNVLASTRPIHQAVALELRRRAQEPQGRGEEVLDALKRFDSSGLLLHRTRHVSAALWGLERRLARPIATLSALEWRLDGPVGPVALARQLVLDAEEERLLEGEARFIIAEIALTIARVDWVVAGRALEESEVTSRVDEVLTELRALAEGLGGTGLGQLDAYIAQAFSEVTR